MEQYGNTNYNLETVLVQNIKNSPYYIKKAMDLDNAHEIIDEIYETVDHVEPWLSGNARGPSSAFCLLYRLGQLKPSAGEVREMVDHKDSAYIRALGLLYLRYCCNPRDLWSWFKKYVRDTEEFTPSPGSLGKSISIGEFARDILLDQYYFETIFPRIPKTVGDEIRGYLRDWGLPTEARGNAGQGGADRRGMDDGSRRPASVKASLSVAFGQRAPNRPGVREVGRGMGSDLQLDRARGGGGGRDRPARRSSSPDQRQQREGEWRGARGGGRRSRSRSRSRDSRRPADADRGDRGRDHWRERERSRERYRERSRDGYQDRGRGEYEQRRRGEDRRGAGWQRHARSRSRSPSRGARDVFKDRAAAPAQLDKIRDAYG